jgi:WhiB family redox-sensing transcriptional regulator
MRTDELDLLSGAQAACAGASGELFFPTGRDTSLAEPAKAYCRRCPLIRDCLAYALTHKVEGVWGGTTIAERDVLRDRHRIAAEPVELDGLIHPTRPTEIAS